MDTGINVANPLENAPIPVAALPNSANPITSEGQTVQPGPAPLAAATPSPAPTSQNLDPFGNPAPQPSRPQPPAPKAAPGSFAQKLLSAIGGVLQTANATVSSIGNADANPNTPLGGVERQIAADNARIEAQKRYQAEQAQKAQARQDLLTEQQRIQQREDDEAHARIAESNARVHTTQQSAYYQNEADMEKRVTQGQADLKSMTTAEVPAQVIQHGVDDGNMTALLNEGKINGYEYTAIPTGTKVIGTENGSPKSVFTYDIVKVPQQWTPTDDQIARIKTVPGYEKFQKGTVLTGAQVLSALTQADTIRATHDTMNAARAASGIAEMKANQETENAQFSKSGDWLRFLNTYSGNPVQAAQHILSDPGMAKKYPGLFNDVMKQFATTKDPTGTTEYETMRHQYATEAEARVKDAMNGQGGLATSGGGAMTDAMKANIGALSKDKQAIIDKYDGATKAALYSIAFGPGDMSLDVFPNRVSAKSGQLDKEHAGGVIKQLTDGRWSEQQYRLTSSAYKEITSGRSGQDAAMYSNLLEHMSNAQDVIEDSLRAANPRFLNSAINLAETQGWGNEATKIQTALAPVMEEFSRLMSGGHALHADQQALYQKLTDPAATPSQLEAAFKNFGATGIIRLEQINGQYKRVAGNNIPGLVTRDAIEAAKHLNLDPVTQKKLSGFNSAGTIFANPQWNPSQEEVKQTDDTAAQQKQALAEQVKVIAQQAMSTGKAPQGTAGIAISPTDQNWYYVDAQHKPLQRVQ